MKTSDFKWTKKREKAALMLAQAYTIREVAEELGISERTIYRWKDDVEFLAEVDRLTFMTGVALRAERLRIAMRVIKARTDFQQFPVTNKDLLEWVKYAQSETDGVKLDLAALIAAASDSVADS